MHGFYEHAQAVVASLMSYRYGSRSKGTLMSEAPQWLTSLIDAVGNCMEAHCATGPLAFRWGNEEDFWEVRVYCTPGEAVGGAEDGAILVPGFSLDLMGLTSIFEELTDRQWQAHSFGPHDQEGPHISVEGVYQGHHVYLQVLAEAPER
jgi:hypothetical protein